MNDKLKVLFLFTFLFMLCFKFDTILAGECDCKPTYDAKAKVSDDCSTIWNNNSCILKEVGKSSQSSSEMSNWTYDVTQHLNTAPRSIYNPGWPSRDINLNTQFYAMIRPRIQDLRYFERLVIFTLAGEVPSRFAAQVIDGIRKHRNQVIEGWQKSEEASTSFEYHHIRFILKRNIIYATKDNISFYINLRREGPAPSFP